MKTQQPFEYGMYYHVYHRGVNGENIFKKDENYAYFLKKYVQYISPISDTFAYCLLKNHFHILIKTKEFHQVFEASIKFKLLDENKQRLYLSQQFSNFLNSYSKSINKAFKRHGSLFSGPLKRKCIDNNVYLDKVFNYIHLNPVHHGFVEKPEYYQYSSFNIYLHQEENNLISPQKRQSDLLGFDVAIKRPQHFQLDDFD